MALTAHPNPLHAFVGDLAFNHNPTSHNCGPNCFALLNHPPESPTRCVRRNRSVWWLELCSNDSPAHTLALSCTRPPHLAGLGPPDFNPSPACHPSSTSFLTTRRGCSCRCVACARVPLLFAVLPLPLLRGCVSWFAVFLTTPSLRLCTSLHVLLRSTWTRCAVAHHSFVANVVRDAEALTRCWLACSLPHSRVTHLVSVELPRSFAASHHLLHLAVPQPPALPVISRCVSVCCRGWCARCGSLFCSWQLT